MDSLSANIEYVQENIVELQTDLIAMDDVKCDGDTVDSHFLITSCSPKEAKYLLEHLLDLVLNLVSVFLYAIHIGTWFVLLCQKYNSRVSFSILVFESYHVPDGLFSDIQCALQCYCKKRKHLLCIYN